MSTKTLRKRIALVAVSALGFGVLSVAPSSAAAATMTTSAATATAVVELGTTFSTVVREGNDAVAAEVTHTITLTKTSSPVGSTATAVFSAAGNELVGDATADTGYLVGYSGNVATVTATAAPGTALGTVANPLGVGTMQFTPDRAGKYVFTLTHSLATPTNGTVTIYAVPAASSTLQAVWLQDNVLGSIIKASVAAVNIGVTRPAGASTANGAILLKVNTSPDTDFAPGAILTPGTTAGVTTTTNSSANTITLAAANFDTAGNYSLTAFQDTHGDSLLTSGEASSVVTFYLAGAPYSVSLSSNVDSIPNVTTTSSPVLTATVKDLQGNPTFSAGTLNLAFDNAAAAGVGAATALTRVGLTNTYTLGVVFTAAGATTAGVEITATATDSTVATAKGTAAFTISDSLATTATKLAATSASGIYFGTAGAATYTTVLPARTTAGTTAISAAKTVKTITYTLTGTASKVYAVSLTTTGGRDVSRYTYPSTVTTLADGTVTFQVTNSAPVASSTTPDTYTITVAPTVGATWNYTVTYVSNQSLWTLSPSATTLVGKATTNTVTATLKDKFGNVMANQPYTVSVTGRNVSASSGTTSATGVATYTVTDAATSSYDATLGYPTDTVAFTSLVKLAADGTTDVAASAATSVTFKYVAALTTVGTIVVTSPVIPTIDQIEADPTAPTTVTYTATVRDLDGAVVVAGNTVTWAGSSDDLFANDVKTSVTDANGQATIAVYRHKVGYQVITATSNGVTGTSTANLWANDPGASAAGTADGGVHDGRNVAVSAAQSSVGGSAATVVAKVTDRWGNAVAGVLVTWSYSGVGRPVTGAATATSTDVNGQAQFQVTALASETGVMNVAATISGGQTTNLAGKVVTSSVAGVTAGNTSATSAVTFTKDTSTSTADALLALAQALGTRDQASATVDAAAEATDAANAATDAANAAAEAADAATAAAQDASDAVAALSAQVSEAIAGLKKQLVSLTNLVIKIQKKVKA